MTISVIAEKLGARILSGSGEALLREVRGGHCGDLLSWVMGKIEAGDIWVTIMSNPNVAAVAFLSGAACVLLAEGVLPDEGLMSRALDEDIPLMSSEKSAFALCGELYGLFAAPQGR